MKPAACPSCGGPISASFSDPVCPRCSVRNTLGDPASNDDGGSGIEGYELIFELGRGAMGVVWLARDRSLGRLVAIKRIPTGADPGLSERLEREGRAAAGLRHPNIVAVHAIGGTGASTFLAMDFLEGGNLDEALKGKPLEPRAAATLSGKLADALAYAHGSGVLHRDIKPSNVLMGENMEPVLGDFGLATAVGGAGELSVAGHVVGTPAYLAPELLAGKDRASVLTDIYGLGAVLYVCLTGRPLFTGGSTAAILAQVTADEPVAPRVLQRDVPRDLETICLKCLEKSPSKRYASAAEVRDDLQRFLRGEPIAARPVGRLEKVVRWSAREPGSATAVALAVVVFLLVAIGLPIQLARLARARDAALAERARAEAEAASSKAVLGFLRDDLLDQAAPDIEPDRDIKLRAVLERASRKIEGRFSKQPEVEASVREALADTYDSIGEFATAMRHFERAETLRRALSGAEAPETLHSMSRRAFLLLEEGRYSEAEALERSTLATQQRVLGPESRDALSSVSGLAFILHEEGRLPEAEALASKNLEVKRRVLGEEDPSTVESIHSLAVMVDDEGNYELAEKLNLQALKLQQKILGADNPQTLLTMSNLGHVRIREGRYADGEAVLLKALELQEAGPGLDHPIAWYIVDNLAFAARLQGHYAQAEAYYRQAVDIGRKVLGAEHPNTLFAQWGLASLYVDEGKIAEAEPIYEQTFAIRRRVLGSEHPETLDSEDSLGDTLLRLGRLADAEPILRESVALRMKNDPGDWHTSHSKLLLGRLLAASHRYSEAEPLLLASYERLERDRDRLPASARTFLPQAARLLEAVYSDTGQREKAAEWEHIAAAGSAGGPTSQAGAANH